MGESSSGGDNYKTASINFTPAYAYASNVDRLQPTVVGTGTLVADTYTSPLLSISTAGEMSVLYVATTVNEETVITAELTIDGKVLPEISVTSATGAVGYGLLIAPAGLSSGAFINTNIKFKSSFSIRVKSDLTTALNMGYRYNGLVK